jgi:hypothetical protein
VRKVYSAEALSRRARWKEWKGVSIWIGVRVEWAMWAGRA